MALVMLADLPPGLPGLPSPPAPRGAWDRTDLCDYASIWNAALNVRDGCLSIVRGGGGGGGRVGFVNPAGYNTAGMKGAIGVFLWDTDSVINQAVRERRGGTGLVGGGGSGAVGAV